MADVDDVRSMPAQVDQQVEKVNEAAEEGAITTEDAQAILDCYQRLRRTDWSAASTRRDRITQLRLSATRSDKPLVDYDSESDTDAILNAHERAGASSVNTQRGYAVALKSFFEFLDDHTDYGAYPWYSSIELPSRNGNTHKDPSEMLDERDITALREAANNPRDKFYIEFLADTGLRATAASQLRIGDVNLETRPPTFSPNADGEAQKGLQDHELGKFPLHDSTKFLREWINSYHPDPHDDAPLWPVLNGYDPADRSQMAAHPRTLQDQIDEAAAAAGVEKPVNLHSFRHACVKRLRLKYEFTWDEIGDRVAWSDNSVAQMAQIYGRLEADERLARLYQKFGYEPEGGEDAESAEPAVKACVNCGAELKRSWDICPECHAEQDPKGALRETYQGIEDMGALEKLQRLDELMSDPEVQALLDDQD